MALRRQGCTHRFCRRSLIQAKDGTDSTPCGFPLGVSELVRTRRMEPMVNRSSNIPVLFLFGSSTISAEILPASRTGIQERLLAHYVLLRWTSNDRTSSYSRLRQELEEARTPAKLTRRGDGLSSTGGYIRNARSGMRSEIERLRRPLFCGILRTGAVNLA